MKELLKIIHDIREKNNCNYIEIYGSSMAIAKLPKDLELDDIKFHEIPCDNDTIYILPTRSQLMQYIIENNKDVIFEE